MPTQETYPIKVAPGQVVGDVYQKIVEALRTAKYMAFGAETKAFPIKIRKSVEFAEHDVGWLRVVRDPLTEGMKGLEFEVSDPKVGFASEGSVKEFREFIQLFI